MKVRTASAAAILAGALTISATAAHAAVLFDFGVGPNGVTTNSWANNQGQTHTYTASGLTIIASSFGPARNGVADQLYGKHSGGDENGLGMTNDPSGDHEVYYGKGFIQLDVSQLYSKIGSDVIDLDFGSTTGGEQWVVYGSNTAGTVGSSALPMSKTFIGSGGTENTLLKLIDGFKYYDVESYKPKGGENILIEALAVEPAPEPAAWALMIVGVLSIGGALRQRRSRAFPEA